MPETSTVTSRIAGLADGPQQVISGVAVGAGDVTRGLSGDRKVWTEEELKEAAETLEGGDLKALHSETPVGTVTDAGYVDGEGVIYEARVDDAELAEAIANGRLTVSVEARHGDGGTVETDRGEAMRAADIEFSDLAIVQRGAAPSASAEPGEAAALEAALAPAAIHAALEEDDEEDPASTEGDASDIDISESTEEGLENKVEEHNEEVDSGKEVTLGQLKKVFRRGAGAWFSSNKGATQNQWAYARVNEALDDIKSEKAINHGNDNDIFESSLDYDPPESERSAALVDVNGTEVDLEAPPRVKNAIEAALDAKEEYADEIGDCGTGVGEAMGRTILDDDLTPEIITAGGDIAQYGPATYLDGHGDEGPATDDPPTDWGREEWLGIVNGGSPRCGPVQLALWGYYLDWFESAKQEVEAAMEDSEMAMDDTEIPEAYRFSNPGEAVAKAKEMGVGEGRDLAGDEMIHTHGDGEETVFMPAPTHEALLDRLREMDALADPLVDRPTGGDTRTVVHTPTEESPDEATLDAIRESVADRTGVEMSMTATEAGVLTEATPDVGIGVREFVHEHLDIVESVVQNALGKVQKSSLHVAGDADGLSLQPCFEVGGELSDGTLSRLAETFALVANHRVAVGMADGMVMFDPRDPVLSHAALDVAEIITRRAADENGVPVTGNTFRAAEMLEDADVIEPPSLPAEAGHHDTEESEMAADVALPMPSESVQLLYPEQSVAADAARAMGLGEEDDADEAITHPHDFEGETWYMPGETHGAFVDAVSGMDAGMAGTAPVARLNEYKAVGPIEFRGTRDGDLDEAAIPVEGYESHYFNAGDTKSASSFPLVDGEGYLRRGNLDAAWNLRGQGNLGMPRDSAERLMLNLGLVFGPPDSEANPLPQAAYAERDDVGTPFAEAAAALTAVVDAVTRRGRRVARPDDPETGEVPGDATTATAALSTAMTDDPAHDAALGSYLANAMAGKMEEMAYRAEMTYAEMMREMSDRCGMSESHMRSIRRGDTGCPSLEAIEAMSDVLDADMGMLLAAAERDGCEYSEAGYGGGADAGGMTDTDDTEERMADSTTKELKATLADKTERIEELESEIADLRAERDAVASEYAEALAGTDTVLDAETMAEKFTVAELAEMYEDAADAALAPEDPEPAVRSGSDGSTPESEALSGGDREQIAELEDELDQWEQRDSRLAAVRTEEIEAELADLRGDN